MNRVRESRQLRGMTLTELANKMNMAPQSVNALESGRRQPGPKVLQLLVEALNVHPSFIRGEDVPIPCMGKTCSVIRAQVLEDQSSVLYTLHDEEGAASALLTGGILYTAQTPVEQTEDIRRTVWLDPDGDYADMIDGLPRRRERKEV